MPHDLRLLLDEARREPVVASDVDAKIRSFAYGNLAIEHPETTRESVDRAVDAMNERLRGLAR